MRSKIFKQKKKIALHRGSRILFVCYGNHARSPMAEGLARKKFSDSVWVDSAGVNPLFEGAAEEAIQVLHEDYGLDISRHTPKHVRDVEMSRIDFVVALDPVIHEYLKKIYLIPKDKLIMWKIEDPFSLGLKFYRKTADKLDRHIQDTFEDLNADFDM
jgi:arsenate reductase